MWGQRCLKCRDFLSPQGLKKRPAVPPAYLVQAKLAAGRLFRSEGEALHWRERICITLSKPCQESPRDPE